MIMKEMEKTNSGKPLDNDMMKEMPWARTAEIYVKITDVLLDIGVSVKLGGYDLLREAIWVAWLHSYSGRSRCGTTTIIYPWVAEHLYTSPSKVEKNIRAAIAKTWGSNDMHFKQKKYFGNSISREKGKPTNSEFIWAVVNYLERPVEESQPEHTL